MAHSLTSPVIDAGCHQQLTYDLSMWLLGLLTTWWLGSKGEGPERKERGNCITYSNPYLEVIQHHFHCIPFTDSYKDLLGFEGTGNTFHLLMGRWQNSGIVCETRNTFVATCEKYNLLYVETHNGKF